MKLFTPGPVQVKENVMRASASPIRFHRAKGFEELYSSCTKNLAKVFKSTRDDVILILNGAGTYANEAVINSLTSKNDKILIFSNGDFGDRLEKMLKLHNRNFKTFKKQHGQLFEDKEIEVQIKEYSPDIVIIVALETSTGLVNPVKYLGQLSREYKFNLFVDAVSALGAEDISIERDNIAVCTSVPNKAIEALPGISFVCVKKYLLDKTNDLEKESFYLDLHKYYEYSPKNQTPTTPAVTIYSALDEALKELLSEGLQSRRNRYHELSGFVREQISSLGFRSINFEVSKDYSANAITCMQLPEKYRAIDLHNYLYSKGLTLWFYDHKGINFQDNVMQISVMGDINKDDLKQLFSSIKNFIDEN